MIVAVIVRVFVCFKIRIRARMCCIFIFSTVITKILMLMSIVVCFIAAVVTSIAIVMENILFFMRRVNQLR